MTVSGHRLEFGPPPTQGLSRALVLAVIAHLVLLAVLTLGVQWRRTPSTTPVEAELWSAIPKAAAPRLVEPPPAPPPPKPAAPPVVKAPPVAPTPDADIALKQEKEQLEKAKLAAQQREEALRKKEKLAADKKREQERQLALEKKHEQELREKEQKDKLAADKKREQDKLAAEKKREQDKLVADKKREQEQQQKAKEEQARLETQRKVNLQRMAGLAGASGAPGATGTAQKSSGSSSSYSGRISAIVKPNIVFTETTSDNPTALVEVRAAPDGTIVGRKLVKSSGNAAWDDAVLKAIDKTAVLPRDIDGTVPPLLEIHFRRHD